QVGKVRQNGVWRETSGLREPRTGSAYIHEPYRAVRPKDQAVILGIHDRRLISVKNLRGVSDHADLAISGGIDRVDVPASIGIKGNDFSVGGLPGARVQCVEIIKIAYVGPGQRAPAATRREDLGVGDAVAVKIPAAENEQLTGIQSDEGGIPTCERHWARRIGGHAVGLIVKNVGVRDALIYCS